MADYLTVTEIPGNKATREQIERLYHRYHFASTQGHPKEVLEVACGAGMGLGYLKRAAEKVTGGDIDDSLLKIARDHYQGRPGIEIRALDAQSLPFSNGTFDLVILFEAIYYLPRPEAFVDEACRVLKPQGALMVCTVNKDWPDFNPSPFSHGYLSSVELCRLLKTKFPSVELLGAFPARMDSLKDRVLSLIKRAAVGLHLVPKTMKGKEFFKRFFFGGLIPIPPEIIPDMAVYQAPFSLVDNQVDSVHKVLYAVARKASAEAEEKCP